MDLWLRHIMPFGMTLGLLLLTCLPVHIPGLSGVMPMLPLMSVYYWALFRPDLLPVGTAFAIGLTNDILVGMPLGVNALVLASVQRLATTQRRFFLARSFLASWLAFALLAAGAVGLGWLLMEMMAEHPVGLLQMALAYLATLGLFPAATQMMARAQMAFLKDV